MLLYWGAFSQHVSNQGFSGVIDFQNCREKITRSVHGERQKPSSQGV
jgi:hypothetical protein